MYQQFQPHHSLQPYIDAYWTVDADCAAAETLLPDGCTDVILNFGDDFYTDNGRLKMEHRKIYLVGTMTTYKNISRSAASKLTGIRFKPGALPFFYDLPFMKDIANGTVEMDKDLSPSFDKTSRNFTAYLDRYFMDRLTAPKTTILPIIADIYRLNGQIKISELCQRHCITDRQLERYFMAHLGVNPKAFINFVRCTAVLEKIRENQDQENLFHIAWNNGFYDHAHLANEVKKHTGLIPSQIK